MEPLISDMGCVATHSIYTTLVYSVFLSTDYITITKLACRAKPYKVVMLGTDECPVMNVQDFAGRKIKNCNACLDDSTKVGKASINVFGYEWICMNQ